MGLGAPASGNLWAVRCTRFLAATVALSVLGPACTDDGSSRTEGYQSGQCPGSVVRRVDGGHPTADALPNVDGAVTDRSRAEAVFARDRGSLIDRYQAERVSLAEGFGRAWAGENGGDYQVVDVNDFGIVVTLRSMKECPTGAALYVTSRGPYGSEAELPLFFFARL